MEPNYAVNLAISILLFAPGLVFLIIALFVGALAGFERAGALKRLGGRKHRSTR